MAQDESGKWEVVDGMQRLSTIFDFLGILRSENTSQEGYTRFDKLEGDLYYLKGFDGKEWDDFSSRIKLDFKRTKIQLTILMRETNADAKFELFQRLNSGGTRISAQELRNAILASENSKMLKWFEELADYSAFKNVVGLSSGDLRIRYDMELVLRFMAFLSDSDYESKLKNFNSVDVFLTHVLRGFIKEEKFDYEGKEALFKRTFDAIYAAYGKDALKYKNAPATGKFSISFFEAVAFGIAQNLNELPDNADLKSKIVSIAKDSRYSRVSGSGKNIKSRTPALLALGKEYFKKSQ